MDHLGNVAHDETTEMSLHRGLFFDLKIVGTTYETK